LAIFHKVELIKEKTPKEGSFKRASRGDWVVPSVEVLGRVFPFGITV